MYDPFAMPPVPGMFQTMGAQPMQTMAQAMAPPGQVQTMGAPMPNALAGLMRNWRPGMPLPPGMVPPGVPGQPGTLPPQQGMDWRAMRDDWRGDMRDWREARPERLDTMAPGAWRQAKNTWRDTRPDKPDWR